MIVSNAYKIPFNKKYFLTLYYKLQTEANFDTIKGREQIREENTKSMKQKIRMVGLDLDGTLLDSQKQISQYTRTVIERALAQGIEVLVSTGRPISAIPQEILTIPGMKYAVTANGARIIELAMNRVIYENLLSVEIAAQVVDVLQDYDTIHEIFIDGKSYTYAEALKNVYDYFEEPGMAEYLLNTRIPVENVKETLFEFNASVDKVHGIFRNLEERKAAIERLKQIQGIVVTGAFGNSLEINKEGTDKGKGMLRLGELLGIKQEEIMACGDGMNDYEMLKSVGFAVAMENGHSRLKEIADYIAASNNEDGVAKAIEKFVLEKE